MSHAREIRPFHHFPDPDYHDNLQRLERDITELAAHINAASYQLLELVGLYDEQKGWVQHGLASCAHWLQWQCGTNLAAAREALNEENRRHALRELRWYVGDHGCWVFKGRFSPEQGALIAKALEKAVDQQFHELQDEHPDVIALTPKGGVDEWQLPHPIATRRTDALERLAESFLAGDEGQSAGGDRYLVNIHTEAEVLQADGAGAKSECEDGGHVTEHGQPGAAAYCYSFGILIVRSWCFHRASPKRRIGESGH